MIIISEDLKLLSDEQITILDYVIKYRRYSDIVSKLDISRDNLSREVITICEILNVYPRTPMSLRSVWKTSIKHCKMQREVQKQKPLEVRQEALEKLNKTT
jgi:DNA-directed RNA polymerase subunit F